MIHRLVVRSRSGLWLIGVVSAVALPTPVLAQIRVEGLAATDLFNLADKACAAGRLDDAGVLYDALIRDPDREVRAEARFRKGMMLANTRRFKDAALEFRALLDEKPVASGVRLELARMLAAIGDERAARRELRQAEATGLPADVAITVGQFAQALRSAKRSGVSVEIAMAPDSNVNRATQSRTVDTVIAPLTLSDDAREKSGLGLKLATQAFVKIGLAPGLALVPRASGAASIYRSTTFDDISASALVGLEWQRGTDRWSPAIGQSWRWYGGKQYARTMTTAVDWLHPIGSRSQILANVSVGSARYQRNALQNSLLIDAYLTYERAFSGRMGASATLSFTRQTARDPGYATTSNGISATGWKEQGRSTFFLRLGVHHLESDGRLFLFLDRRREWLWTASTGATLRRFAVKGFAPFIKVEYDHNISTVQLYAYRRFAGEVGAARAF
jgi:tetratricopeptide (TPR) repeat protein